MLSPTASAQRRALRMTQRVQPADIGRAIAQIIDLEDFAVKNGLNQTLFTDTVLVAGLEHDGRVVVGTASGQEFEITIKAR